MLINKLGLKFIFINIPYCGGDEIDSIFGNENINDYKFELKNKLNKNVKNYKLVDYSNILNENINDYFKFTLVRNPWDRMVFNYINDINNQNIYFNNSNKKEEKEKISFESYINVNLDEKNNNVYDYLSWYLTNKSVVDYVCRYETINSDFSYICGRLGIDNIKINFNNIYNYNYKDYYDKNTKDLIFNNFKNEILKYKYEF